MASEVVKHRKFSNKHLLVFGFFLSLVLLTGVEGLSWLALRFLPQSNDRSLTKYQSKSLELFQPEEKSKLLEVFREQKEAYVWRYVPQLAWVNKPYSGIHVNIAADGSRKTYAKPNNGQALKVLCLGGSSTWGWNLADDQTWPSALAMELTKKFPKRNVQVLNFGENGYETSLEIARLQALLVRGYRPDFVVFYTGYNTSEVWLFPHYTPGFHGDVAGYQLKFREKPKSLSSALSDLVVQSKNNVTNLNIYKLLRRARSGDSGPQAFSTQLFDDFLAKSQVVNLTLEEHRELTKKSVSIFREYVNIIYALATQYGFVPIVAVQPDTYLTKRDLTDFEKEVSDAGTTFFEKRGSSEREFINAILADNRLLNWSNLGEETAQPRFFDTVHPLPQFAKVIGKSFSDTIASKIQ